MARVDHDQGFGHASPQQVPPVRARQGLLGVPVLMVLVAGLILAAVAWFGAALYGEAITPPASEQVGNPANPSTELPAGANPPSSPATATRP